MAPFKPKNDLIDIDADAQFEFLNRKKKNNQREHELQPKAKPNRIEHLGEKL